MAWMFRTATTSRQTSLLYFPDTPLLLSFPNSTSTKTQDARPSLFFFTGVYACVDSREKKLSKRAYILEHWRSKRMLQLSRTQSTINIMQKRQRQKQASAVKCHTEILRTFDPTPLLKKITKTLQQIRTKRATLLSI